MLQAIKMSIQKNANKQIAGYGVKLAHIANCNDEQRH